MTGGVRGGWKIDYSIASDIGGTNLRVGLVSVKGQLEQKIDLKTPQNNPDEVVSALINAIAKLDTRGKSIIGVGVGVGGVVDFAEGRVIKTPNFSFSNIYLEDIITKKFRLRTFVDNDANLAALGEKAYGAGKGVDNLVCLTLGTGIGGGIIINGKLYRGSGSGAGEIGHMTIQIGGAECACGNDGDLEALASGRSLGKEAAKCAEKNKDSLIFKIAMENNEPITGALVTKAALEGDELANSLIAKHAFRLGVGLANIANVLDPELIILVGGMAEAGNLLLTPAKETLKNRVFADNKRVPKVVFGGLGTDAGILGAAALVFEQLER